MSKKYTSYIGEIDSLISEKILLNVNNLKDGTYVLEIVCNNKVVKRVTFIKHTT